MLNLFPRKIVAVSNTNISVISVQYGYVGLVQASGYHGHPRMVHIHTVSGPAQRWGPPPNITPNV